MWRGQSTAAPELEAQPTRYDALDALLPTRGWPTHTLSELLPVDDVGEISVAWYAIK